MTEFLESHGYAAKSVFQSQQLHNQNLRSCEKQMADCNLSWLISHLMICIYREAGYAN